MRDPAPWTRQQLVAVAALAAIGAAMFAAAWWGSADEETLSGQSTWLSVATGGVVVAMCGGGALLLFGHRAVGGRQRRLLARVASVPTASPTVHESSGWVTVTGTRRAHRTACPLVRGKQVEVVDPEGIRERRLQRCEVCGS